MKSAEWRGLVDGARFTLGLLMEGIAKVHPVWLPERPLGVRMSKRYVGLVGAFTMLSGGASISGSLWGRGRDVGLPVARRSVVPAAILLENSAFRTAPTYRRGSVKNGVHHPLVT